MNKLLSRFIDICRLRAGPQDLPSSSVLLGVSLVLYTGAGFLLVLTDRTLADAAVLVVVDLCLLIGLAYVVLWIKVLTARYTQTLTALAGCGGIMQLVSLPIVLWQQHNTPGGGPLLLVSSLLLWGWLIWNVAVIGHILHHALSTKIGVGIALSVLYMYISFSVIRTFFMSTAT